MYQITLLHRVVSVILIGSILQSCSYYKFRTASNSPSSAETKKQIDKRPTYENYYIVHDGDKAYQLDNVIITNDSISGRIATMNLLVKKYMMSAYEGGKRRVPKEHLSYINQVHIFADNLDDSKEVALAVTDIERLDLMNMNRGLKIATVAGVTLGSTAVGLTVLLLIACNCPHTYVFDGQKYYYNNTLYTGATSKALERHDYKIMPDYTPESESYDFYIQNEEEEHQFTNLLELIVVEHDKSIEVSMDQHGQIYSLAQLAEPMEVKDNSGNDLTNLTAYADDAGHMFDNESQDNYNNVFATFQKPENTQNAKIVLNVKNHQWGGFVYNEFSKMFGKYYDNWVKRNHKLSKEEVMENMKKIGIPMTISVKKEGQWIELETINLVGDVNYNSLVVPVDADLLTDESIELRVQSGFMFWELDRINMDFSAPLDLGIQRLAPISAEGTNDRDDSEALALDDDQYMAHLQPGDSTHVSFQGIQNDKGMHRTIYLHSKGYYLPQKEFSGKLQRKELAKINVDAGLSIFSRELYDEAFGNLSLNPTEK